MYCCVRGPILTPPGMIAFILLTLASALAVLLMIGAATETRGIDIKLYVDISGTMTLVGGLRSVDLTINGESIDASHGGSGGWRNKLGSLRDWSASAGTVILMDINPGVGVSGFDAAFAELKSKLQDGNTPGQNVIGVEIEYPDTSTDTGTAIITQLQMSGPYDGVAEGSISLEGNGALTYTPKAA